MQSLYQLLLLLGVALGALGLRGASLRRSSHLERLELEPYNGALPTRIRRQALAGAKPCLTLSYLTDMKQRFAQRIDPNDDGKASAEEMRQYLMNFNPGVTDQQVASFLKRRDLNGNGVVEFIPEYVLDIATPDMTPEAAAEWFALEDGNGDGFVSLQELTRIAQHLGMSPEQAEENVMGYYMAYDLNGDNKLNFDEYKVIYGQ